MKLLRDRKRLVDDFPVPIETMFGFQRTEEIKQFYYINSQAKNVPTDLTAELLQRMARQDSGEAEYLSERKNKSSLPAGAAVYDALVKNQSPRMRRIRRPNEPYRRTPRSQSRGSSPASLPSRRHRCRAPSPLMSGRVSSTPAGRLATGRSRRGPGDGFGGRGPQERHRSRAARRAAASRSRVGGSSSPTRSRSHPR